jgi:hypothetical protein
VAKYMGDGVLVYFGYPQAHEDDAERAVYAALELVAAVGQLKTHAPLQTRVGIATGSPNFSTRVAPRSVPEFGLAKLEHTPFDVRRGGLVRFARWERHRLGRERRRHRLSHVPLDHRLQCGDVLNHLFLLDSKLL